MPFSLLIAIFIAFGFEANLETGSLSTGEVRDRILLALAGVAAVGVASFLLGEWVAFRVRRHGGPNGAIRRRFALYCRVVDALTLASFAWIIHGVGWPAVIEGGFGLRNAILIDEFLILLPFLLALLLGWWGLYAGERAVRGNRHRQGRSRYLVLKARQALGLVLPVALVFSLGQDLLRRQWPESAESTWGQLAWMAAMGTLVLVLAPAFVRLTWPTRPLEPGPLRDRLERLSRRLHFRCSDILVWDTGNALVNAGVTGALPWFRYVLLTDALVDNLTPNQVEAVFGHEVGHIAHRHLMFFGFFFLGTVGIMTLVGMAIEEHLRVAYLGDGLANLVGGDDGTTMMIVRAGTEIVCLGLYFLLVFGFLSRRFERQADVFGCRAVSCGRESCPPHADLNARTDPAHESTPVAASSSPHLCPAGIRIFANALSDVASLNGMERESWWAWRHGSIARRIAFLEALEGRPEAERRFQRGVWRLRLGLAVLLASAVFAVAAGEAWKFMK